MTIRVPRSALSFSYRPHIRGTICKRYHKGWWIGSVFELFSPASEAAMSINTVIHTIELDGKHYVAVTIDGLDKRYGPFSAGQAEAMAGQIAGICRTLFHSGVVVPARPATRRLAG